MKPLRPFLLCTALATASCASGQLPPAPDDLDALEAAVRREMKVSGAPGAVVAVVQHDRIVYAKAFGLADAGTRRPVETGSVFQAASVTKTITALALLTVLEQQHIGLDTPLGEVIENLSPGLAKVTLHQLLSHTSGMIDSLPEHVACDDDVLTCFKRSGDRMLFEQPGLVFSYSNGGYGLAGLVLARLTGKSYEQAVQELILSPLGMVHSTFDPDDISTGFASGHVLDEENNDVLPLPPRQEDAAYRPAGGLFTNIYDMANLAVALMNDGTFNGKPIFTPATIALLSNGISPFGVQRQYLAYPGSTYSCGAINFSYGGVRFFGHSGEGGDQNALFAVAPEYDTAIIIFSNIGWFPFIGSFESAADAFLPTTGTDETPEFDIADVRNLIGRYYDTDGADPASGYVDVIGRGTALFIRFPGGGEFALEQIGDLKYRFENPAFKFPLEIRFIRDKQGRVKYLNYLWRVHTRQDRQDHSSSGTRSKPAVDAW